VLPAKCLSLHGIYIRCGFLNGTLPGIKNGVR
jgi:hypothetical protein